MNEQKKCKATIQQREALAAERLPGTRKQPVPPRTLNADGLRGSVADQRAEQSQFKRHILGRILLFLFILLAVLSVAFTLSMGEVSVIVYNDFFESSEYSVRIMEAFYTTDVLDACVAQNEKTPELLTIDKRMRALLAQDSIKARSMVVLYTDDGVHLKCVTGVGESEASFGEVFDTSLDEEDEREQFRTAFESGKRFRYFKGISNLKQCLNVKGFDDFDHLMDVDHNTAEGTDVLRVQMVRGHHTYFLCAEAGRFHLGEKDEGQHGTVSVDGAVGTLVGNIQKMFAILITRLLFIYIAAFILMLLLIGRTVIIPIRKLEGAARKLIKMTKDEADPNRWTYESPKIRTRDEIQSLAETVSDLATELKQTTIGLMGETAARERLNTELSLASSIQQNSLQSEFPAFPERDDFDIIAMMSPAKEVGGDFYDFFLLDEDHLVFLIADVSSKGVPAALFMMQAKTLLRNGFVYSSDIERIFSTVNDRLCEGNEESMFVTCWMAVAELSTGLLSIVDAGHEPALLVRDGACTEIATDAGLVLAAFEGSDYKKTTITLRHGDRVFLFTDGLNEAQNRAEELYDFERLEASVARHAGDPLVAMKDAVIADMEAFVDGADQFDDQTLLIFEYK